MSNRAGLDSLQSGNVAWLDGLMGHLRKEMVGPEGEPERVDQETRILLLEQIQSQVGKQVSAQATEIWKTRVQRTFLAGTSVFLLIIVGIGTGLLLHTESRATAKAWRILNERQLLAARTGREAAKGAMVWLMARVKEVDEDQSATPDEKTIWKANILQIAQQVNFRILVADQTVQRLSVAETPSRIDAFTFFRDPFTGRTLPVNATDDGRIDEAAVAAYTKQDDQMLRLVAMAKSYSQKGAHPLPPFLFDEVPSNREKLKSQSGEK